MKSVLASVILLGLAAPSAFAQGPNGLTINTPSNVVVCEPILLTWGGGTPPYIVSVLPAASPSGPAVVTFPQTSATELTWLVNQQANTMLSLSVRDNTGGSDPSAPFTVLSGSNSSCVTAATTSISLGGTVSAASTPIISVSSTAPVVGVSTTTSPSSTPTGSTGSSPASTTAKGTASATPKSGASRVTGQVAAAGILAVAIVALFG